MRRGETVLVARRSPFQMIVLSEDENGLRTLRFGEDGVSQSIVKVGDPQHLELPYARVLPLCLAFRQKPERLLVIGLGGGTLPRFFHHQLQASTIDVVEIDPDVVDIAKSHCGFCEDARMHVYVEDGRDFIESCFSRYEMIILDSFDAESIPPHLLTLEFLRAVRNALTPDGVVVANIWGRSTNRLYERMLNTYRAAFEDVYILDVPGPGTKIFIALPQKKSMTRERLLESMEELSAEGTQQIIDAMEGFRHSDLEWLRDSTLLRD